MRSCLLESTPILLCLALRDAILLFRKSVVCYDGWKLLVWLTGSLFELLVVQVGAIFWNGYSLYPILLFTLLDNDPL